MKYAYYIKYFEGVTFPVRTHVNTCVYVCTEARNVRCHVILPYSFEPKSFTELRFRFAARQPVILPSCTALALTGAWQ